MEKIIELAVDFAKNIQKTKEYLNLKDAKEKNDKDLELQKLIKKFNRLKREVKNLIKSKNSNKQQIDELNYEISLTYKKIAKNKNMINFNEKSNEANILMNKINSILVNAINGMELVSGCFKENSFNCGSCKKCSGKI